MYKRLIIFTLFIGLLSVIYNITDSKTDNIKGVSLSERNLIYRVGIDNKKTENLLYVKPSTPRPNAIKC